MTDARDKVRTAEKQRKKPPSMPHKAPFANYRPVQKKRVAKRLNAVNSSLLKTAEASVKQAEKRPLRPAP
ncbi:hypothetical protein QNN00_05100 [Bacillus velezensis]|nr:hypothetical protein [Bacillus velezensis]